VTLIPEAEQFPFVEMGPSGGEVSRLPYLPITLSTGQRAVSVMGLLDTGAVVNVLPYDVGVQLGLVWQQQTTTVRLTGNLASLDARGVVLLGTIGRFAPVRLGFAWTQANTVPVILGQMNFFAEFDAWCSRSRGVFEIKPSGSGG
jgi:hypothetical protein